MGIAVPRTLGFSGNGVCKTLFTPKYIMSSIDSARAFEGLLELLATNAAPEQVLGFRLQDYNQRRVEELLAKSRSSTFTDKERSELESFEHLEHVVRLLKVKMYGRQNQ